MRDKETVQMIERIGFVSIGHTNGRWHVSGFSRNSNTDHRGYGPTLHAALWELTGKIQADEAKRK